MNSLPPQIEYRLLKQKKMLAAEVASSSPATRAWVGIYPLRRDDGLFDMRYFEVERRVIESGVDIAEDELLNAQTYKNITLAELSKLLTNWFDDFNKLVLPFFCDYPI